MVVLVDFGHGINVAGKCSPLFDDKMKRQFGVSRFYEWQFAREIGWKVIDKLNSLGYDARPVVTEDYDVKITTSENKKWDSRFGAEKWDGYKVVKSRVKRINDICAQYGSKNVVLISVHSNANSSDGKWHKAKGFSVFVSKNSSTNSKELAEIFYRNAVQYGVMGNRCVPKADNNGHHFWTWSWTSADIGILSKSSCPAVLTENMFQDNYDDVNLMMSEEGKEIIVNMHVDSIVEYCKRRGG